MDDVDVLTEERTRRVSGTKRGHALRWMGGLLVGLCWASAGVFSAYIVAFYLGAIPRHAMAQWNDNLPQMYERASPVATAAIGAHFLTGAILLLLGPVQLSSAVRRWSVGVHRWVGRVYAAAALVAGGGGLIYIVSKGTIGGWPMNVGFGLYGVLMALAAIQTYVTVRSGRMEAHRVWGVRLFALAIGSWLYRMDYGFWLVLAHGAGHTKTFSGPFDAVMAFVFYLPNLAVAELFLRARRGPASPGLRLAASAVLGVCSFLVGVGTFYFARDYWGPGILQYLRAGGKV